MTEGLLLKTLIDAHRLDPAAVARMAGVGAMMIPHCMHRRRAVPSVVWSAVYELTGDARAFARSRDLFDGDASDDADHEPPPEEVTVNEVAKSMRLFAAVSTTLTEFIAARNLTQRIAARNRYETVFARFITHANAVNTAVYRSLTPDYGSNACTPK